MKDCEECGKKLSVLEGYQHPTLGRKHLLCSHCFDRVSDSVEQWREFVLSNSFNMEKSNSKSQVNLKKIKANFTKIREILYDA
jgi:hypothetical protein